MNSKFRKSYALLKEAMKGPSNKILWTAGEVEDEMSYIECWQVDGKGVVIFQVLIDGHGFIEYMTPTQTERNASKLLEMVRTLMVHMKTHPDCTKDSEFENHVSLAEELIQETTGVKPS